MPSKMGKRRVILAGILFIVAVVTIGYIGISQSSYQTVADLAGISKKTKVTVEGEVAPLGKGTYTLIIDGKVYNVVARGSYGVATDDSGRVYAVFILASDDFAVLALYDVGDDYETYMLSGGLASKVVVSGVFDPQTRAVLTWPGGQAEFPLLLVDAILKGCHNSYSQEVATRG